MEFVGDRLVDRRSFRVLGVVDDCTRECVAVELGDVLTSERLVRVLDRLKEERVLPASIVADNGPEFTAIRMIVWAAPNGVVLDFILPGKPTQNAYAESFNGRHRHECLNQHEVQMPADAAALIEAWREDYGRTRPHSSLGEWTSESSASGIKKARPLPLGEEVRHPVPDAAVLTPSPA